jgi:hypothetical protein
VTGDDRLAALAVGAEDLDRPGQDDDEVVLRVGRREQHLAGLHRPPLTVRGDDSELTVVEFGKRRRLVDHFGHWDTLMVLTVPCSR